MNLDYNEMLEYVKNELLENDLERQRTVKHTFRSRYKHITRVLGWCKRIEDDLECDKDILYTSAIFHDIGYKYGQEEHAVASSAMFKEYAEKHNFDKEFTEKVAYNIFHHSEKKLLNDENTSNELILLLEADLLDEEGALAIVWDLLARGAKLPKDYHEALDEIYGFSGKILDQDFMKTKKAKMYWERKKEFVKNFIDELKFDLFEE